MQCTLGVSGFCHPGSVGFMGSGSKPFINEVDAFGKVLGVP